MILFFLKFCLTNLLFSLVIGLVLVTANEYYQQKRNNLTLKKFSNVQLMLYSLGLGPVFTILILYYLLLVLKGFSDTFYLISVLSIYSMLLFVIRKSLGFIFQKCKDISSYTWRSCRGFNSLKKIKSLLYWFSLLILVMLFLYVYLKNIIKSPIRGHDILVYGNIGKIYYKDKAITYSKNTYNKENGFYFTGSPKPSFSLLLTWEMILNSCFGGRENLSNTLNFTSDMYFKSISAYYGLLIICLQFFWLYKKNKYLALLGILVFLSILRFFHFFVIFHLDSYRIFFLLISWIFLVYSVDRKDNFSIFLLAIFSGLTAFTHLIGVVVALLNCIALFIFLERPFKEKVIKTISVILLILCFGGIHYLLEALWGAEWGFLTYI